MTALAYFLNLLTLPAFGYAAFLWMTGLRTPPASRTQPPTWMAVGLAISLPLCIVLALVAPGRADDVRTGFAVAAMVSGFGLACIVLTRRAGAH